MFRYFGLMYALWAWSTTAAAAQVNEVRLDRLLVDAEKAAILCSPNVSRFRIYGSATEETLSPEFDQRYVINYASLLVSQPGRQFIDEPYRAWSKRRVIECGRYTIEVEAGFYNSNPQGRMGAAPEYLRAAVSHENFQVVSWTSFGECDREPQTISSVDGKWFVKARETEVTTVSRTCKDGLPSEDDVSSKRRVPSLQKALETHERAL